jgi:hypothetical protein
VRPPVIIAIEAKDIGQLRLFLVIGGRRIMVSCCHGRTSLLIIFIQGIQGAFALFKPLWQEVQVFNGGF